MKRVVLFALAAACVVCAPPAVAQQTIEYGSVSGRIIDQQGAAVAGAAVTARQTTTSVTDEAETDRTGRFRFGFLRPGSYELRVSHAGFRPVTVTITVAIGSAYELPVTLPTGGLDEVVTVTAGAPVLETARSQIGGRVTEGEIGTLPMNGRQFLDVALLVPGVAPANIASTQLFPETSAVPGVSLSVGGQRNLSNNFVVDGLSANDDAAGLSGITYGVDAIEQVQVVTSGAQAELGRALGGYVSFVTRSGTNVRRGTAYTFLRDDRFNAVNSLSRTKLPMNQLQYGVSLGGPVVESRTFYFVNGEQRRLDQGGLTTITDANVTAVNARLLASGYQGAPVTSGIFESPVDSTNVFARVDHRLGDQGQLSVRYGLYDVSSANSRGAGGLSAPSASSGLDNLDQTIAVSHTRAVSPRTVVETRAQAARSRLEALPSDAVGPAVSIAGVASFGTSSSSPTGRTNRVYQVSSSLSHQAGDHAVKAGVDVLHNDVTIAFPRASRGRYAFASLQDFVAGTYANGGFTQTFGAAEVTQRNPNLGLYVQDEWKVRTDLTLNLGLRYDLQWLETIDLDRNNVSPRLGVAWAPFAARRTVVRGSAGLLYDRVPLRALANALMSAGNSTDLSRLRQVNVSLSPAQAGAPVFPRILSEAVPTVTLASLSTMDRQLQNASSRQASVEIEHQVGDKVTVSAGVQHLRGRGLLMTINQNVPTCPAVGTNNGCRPNPAYANDGRYSAAGSSSYRALQLGLVHRPAGWGHVRVAYTLSRGMNDVGEFFFSSPIDPRDVSKDWGRSDNDRRHQFVGQGTLQTSMMPATTAWQRLIHGFQASAILQAYSGAPFNITSGVNTLEGTAGRPIVNGAFIARNSGQGTAFFSLGLRVSRSLRIDGMRLELIAEVFNATNRANVVARNTTFGTGAYPAEPAASFGQVTAVGEPRSMQFGLRASF